MSEYDSFYDAPTRVTKTVEFFYGGDGVIVDGVTYYRGAPVSPVTISPDGAHPDNTVMSREEELAAAVHDQFQALYRLRRAVYEAGCVVSYDSDDVAVVVANIIHARILEGEL